MENMTELSKQAIKDADKITDVLNNMSFNFNDFGKAMIMQHNTLQQNYMRAAISFIKARAENNTFVDDRNKATYELCKKLIKEVEDAYLPHI